MVSLDLTNLKQAAANAALSFIDEEMIIGVGTGTTVNYFIEALVSIKHRIEACVASSVATEKKLRALGIPTIDLNAVSDLPIYIDGADEISKEHTMIKGGGGALTREKIIASAAKNFVCIVDESKWVNHLGAFPIAIEVLPMARSFVARQILSLGGDPCYRQGFITDNNNIILDVSGLSITPLLETELKNIPGVVESGLFTTRLADFLLIGTKTGVLSHIPNNKQPEEFQLQK